MIRLDEYLFKKKMARSRSHAKQLIENHQVEIWQNKTPQEKAQWEVISKPSYLLPDLCAQEHTQAQERAQERAQEQVKVQVRSGEMDRFVSRAGLKLEGALETLKLDVKGFRVLDVGISTGGFADCLLQKGAAQVVGVDVGKGQLSPSLCQDDRVIVYEKTNARNLEGTDFAQNHPKHTFDLLVLDVSFISLDRVLDDPLKWLKPNGEVLALIKPQFEVGRSHLNKRGVVKSESSLLDLEQKAKQWFSKRNISVKKYLKSVLRGENGNQEFFLLGQKNFTTSLVFSNRLSKHDD